MHSLIRIIFTIIFLFNYNLSKKKSLIVTMKHLRQNAKESIINIQSHGLNSTLRNIH